MAPSIPRMATGPGRRERAADLGFLQASNVNAVEEMTAVLSLSKQFELHIKMMNSAKEDDQAMTRVLSMS